MNRLCGVIRQKLKNSEGFDLSPALISRVRKDLRWRAKTGNKACQLIRKKNVRVCKMFSSISYVTCMCM